MAAPVRIATGRQRLRSPRRSGGADIPGTPTHAHPLALRATPIPDTARLLTALRFAAERHRGQRRKGADHRPYIEHPIDVATTLATVAGVTDVELLSAALLHDTVEDTPTTLDELESLFGRTVRDLVAEVTDDDSIPSEERKRLQIVRAPSLSPGARLIRIADKLCNVRDIALNPPPNWSLERRRAYFEWTKQVIDAVRGTNAELEREFDEAQTLACRTVEVLDAIEHPRGAGET